MGVFGGIKEAKYSEGGVYVKQGVYKLCVTACKQIVTRKKQDAFVAEFLILESSNPERPVGSAMSWMVIAQPDTPWLGNIKQFLMTVLETEEEKIDESVCEFVVSAENPLKDREVRLSAIDIKTKKNADFTKCKYMPLSMSAAEVQSLHQKDAA